LESGARSKQDPKIVQIQFQYGYKKWKSDLCAVFVCVAVLYFFNFKIFF
jgi:hypothetical protein